MKYFIISILLSSVFFGCSVNKKVDTVTPQEALGIGKIKGIF